MLSRNYFLESDLVLKYRHPMNEAGANPKPNEPQSLHLSHDERQVIINSVKEEVKKAVMVPLTAEIRTGVFKWGRKWFALLLSAVGVIGFLLGWSISIPSMYKAIKDKFSEPHIKNTLQDVASKQAKSIIDEIVRPEAEAARQQIVTIQKELNEIKGKYEDIGNKITSLELGVRNLEKQSKYVGVSTKVYDGDRASYGALIKAAVSSVGATKKDLLDVLRDIQEAYLKTEDTVKTVPLCKANTNCSQFEDEQSEIVDNIYNQFVKQDLIVSRAKAAYLLRFTTNAKIKRTNDVAGFKVGWEDIVAALVAAIESPKEHLAVSKTALDSFRSLIPDFQKISPVPTTDHPETVFDFDKAKEYWQMHKVSIIKELDKKN